MRFSPFLKLNNGFHYLGPKIPGAELNSKTLKLRKFFDLRPLSKVTGVSNIFIFFLVFSFLHHRLNQEGGLICRGRHTTIYSHGVD